jgi:SAM-dependent methyltransferase
MEPHRSMYKARLRWFLAKIRLLNGLRELRDTIRAVEYVRSNAPFWLRSSGDGLPIPPLRLVRSATGTSSLAWSFQSGEWAAQSIVRILEANGVDLRTIGRLLDFGCGCGRVIRHWATLGMEVHGCDYNRSAVRWCRRHLGFASFHVNRLEPPLPFPTEHFELVYALSVFTHLPEPLFRAWIREVCRVVKPGGFVVLTTHGDAYASQLTPDDQARFRSGLSVVRHEDEAGTNRCAVYVSERYVRRTFAECFVVVDFVSRGAKGNPHQDLVLLQKPGSAAARA